MSDNGTTTHPEEATLAAVAGCPGGTPDSNAPASATAPAGATAPAASAPPAAAPVGSAVYDRPALQKAKAKAARRARAKANQKAKAKAQALAQDRKAKAAKTSPKVWASTLGGAIAFTFWTIATATFWKNTFSAETLAALIGSTTTIVAAAAAYFKADLLRSGD